jgi:hypothetical protein
MGLLDFFVVSGPPVSDAVQAEAMQAVFENSKSLSVSEHWLETHHTIMVTLYQAFTVFIQHLRTLAFNESAHTVLKSFWPHALRMCIFAVISIPTIALQKEFTRRPIGIIF